MGGGWFFGFGGTGGFIFGFGEQEVLTVEENSNFHVLECIVYVIRILY